MGANKLKDLILVIVTTYVKYLLISVDIFLYLREDM